MQEYTGQTLEENQWMLKLSEADKCKRGAVLGFLTKKTQKGTMPKAFDEWCNNPWYVQKYGKPKIYLHEETFREGWKVDSARIGKSQNWMVIITPENFRIEIYLRNFEDLLQKCTIKNGEIEGEFMWRDNKLIKK